MPTYTYYAFYTAGGTAYTAGTVTVDIIDGGAGSVLTSGSATTSCGGGVYKYSYVGTITDPIAIFKNNDTGVDIMHQAFFSLKSITVATSGAGAGANAWTYNLVDSGGSPVANADVWVTTDLAGTNTIASGVTDGSGNVIFYLDSGTYYVWCAKSGYSFSNPDTEVVP